MAATDVAARLRQMDARRRRDDGVLLDLDQMQHLWRATPQLAALVEAAVALRANTTGWLHVQPCSCALCESTAAFDAARAALDAAIPKEV